MSVQSSSAELPENLLTIEKSIKEMDERNSFLMTENPKLDSQIDSLKLQHKHLGPRAAAIQFLLFIKRQIDMFEEVLSFGVFINNNRYKRKITRVFGENAQELRLGTHYRKFIAILHWNHNRHDFPFINKLRKVLETRCRGAIHIRDVYHSFAITMERFLNFFNEHAGFTSFKMYGSDFMKRDAVEEYVSFLADDVKVDILAFYRAIDPTNSSIDS